MIQKVDFSLLRYANCWEDAGLLLEGLQIEKGSNILSIASAGDNSFALLLKEPALLVAVDVSEVQLFLVELKKACIKHFDRNKALGFLGFSEADDRRTMFESLAHDLQPNARRYWENHFHLIDAGVIHQGKFERYFQLFAKKILPWIHSRQTIQALFEAKPADDQAIFYKDRWNTWRWRLLFRVFFSRWVMGKFGRDPEFLKQVSLPVGDYIFSQAERELSGIHLFDNYMLRYTLCGNFGEQLPLYLQEPYYEKIRTQIDKMIVFKGFAEDAIGEYGPFDAMNLSNIFEYLDEKQFNALAEKLHPGLKPQAKIAYWNLMVKRKLSDTQPNLFLHLHDLSKSLRAKDQGFFYSDFIIEENQ